MRPSLSKRDRVEVPKPARSRRIASTKEYSWPREKRNTAKELQGIDGRGPEEGR